jgi:hypothetical protein
MKHVASPHEELEPVRLVAGGGTAHERRLLEAASLDVMPPGTAERLEQALSAWAALPAGRGSEPAGASRSGWAVRWGVLGGLGGLALAGWWLARDTREVSLEVSPMSGAAEVSAMPVSAGPVSVAPSPPSALPPTALDHVEPAIDTRRTGAASRPKPRSLVSRSDATRSGRTDRAGPSGNLLEEARRLDRVRAALGARDGTTAQRELAEYRSRFPRGELALEADVLEADLLLLARQPEQARALANALLARPDSGRYRQRLEQLLQRVQPSDRRAGSNPASVNMEERR